MRLHLHFWHFLLFYSLKNCAFIIFISFFDEIPNFRNRILTNQKPECKSQFISTNSHLRCYSKVTVGKAITLELTAGCTHYKGAWVDSIPQANPSNSVIQGNCIASGVCENWFGTT